MKKTISVLILLCLTLGTLSCAKGTDCENTGNESVMLEAGVTSASNGQKPQIPNSDYPDQTRSASSVLNVDSFDALITFSADSININGSGAHAEGCTLTVTSAGSYLLQGKLNDGQVIVDTMDEKKVELVLNGADISCSNNAPIYIISSPKKTVIKLYDDSVNLISDGAVYENLYEDNPSAAIYSKDDLEISGGGELYVSANFDKGIYGKDDLKIDGGSIFVNSAGDGIRGKDSVCLSAGKVVINSHSDGLKTTNAEESDKGNIIVSGGELYITADFDAIQAENSVEITGGIIALSSGQGAENASEHSNFDDWRHPGRQESDDGKAHHGIKATVAVNIFAGSISADCSDDCVNCDGEINIRDGSIYINAGDDGLHADSSLNIEGGYVEIERSYEGYEAKSISVTGGVSLIHSDDDGMNASDPSYSGGGMWGMGNTDCILSISGGSSYVYADGDGIDSNGNIVMTGGVLIVFGPESSGNGAIDYGDGACNMSISGGLLLAVGSRGMADCATGKGQQVIFASTGNIQKGSVVAVTDAKGGLLIAFETPKTIQTIVFSSPFLTNGEKYSVYSGGSSTGNLESNVYVGGLYTPGSLVTSVTATENPDASGGSGGMGGPGGGMGGPGGMGGRPR